MSFKGKVVLITGAGSGVGASCALYFAKERSLLALVDLNVDHFKEITEKLDEIGVDVKKLLISANVATDTERIISETIEKFKRLDILINCAGMAIPASLETTEMEDYDNIMAVNMRGPFCLTKYAIPYLIESNGNVVNVSSAASLRPSINFISYALSKAALDQFTKCAALELSPKGVRVNSVNPGVLDTRFFNFLGDDLDDVMHKYIKAHPIGRLGKATEVVDAIAFLADNKSGFITGAILPVDGAFSIKFSLD